MEYRGRWADVIYGDSLLLMSSPTNPRKIFIGGLLHTSQALPTLPCSVVRGAVTRSTLLPFLLSCNKHGSDKSCSTLKLS